MGKKILVTMLDDPNLSAGEMVKHLMVDHDCSVASAVVVDDAAKIPEPEAGKMRKLLDEKSQELESLREMCRGFMGKIALHVPYKGDKS